jgi:hypothetical protein
LLYIHLIVFIRYTHYYTHMIYPLKDLKKFLISLFLFSLLWMVSSCGGGGGTDAPTITQEGAGSSAISITVTPDKITLPINGSAPFTATVIGSTNTAVTWTFREGPVAGSITPDGVYTASGTPNVYHLIASSQADSSKSAVAIVTVVLPITITPAQVALLPNEPLTFEATVSGTTNPGVTWSIDESSGGSISPEGSYVAPAAEGTFHVRATSQADPSQSTAATVTVSASAPVGVVIQPEAAGLMFGGSITFKATVTGSMNPAVTWSIQEQAGGAVDQSGRYTAPHTEGTFNVMATSAADPSKSGVAAVTVTSPQSNGKIERVSVGINGQEPNAHSVFPFISGDGRYVAFESHATNLVSGDTNNQPDMFVYDRQTKTTRRISMGLGGQQGNGRSFGSKMNWDGQFIVFESDADNLVEGDTNHFQDVFMYDQVNGLMERISVNSAGEQGNSASQYAYISRDGRFVAFTSFASNLVDGDTNKVTNPISDIFVRDRQTKTTTRVSVGPNGLQADGSSWCPSISDDGRFVSFVSLASNLVPGDTNNAADVFVHDRQTGTTSRVSVGPNGQQQNLGATDAKMSGNGLFVAFASEASNLVEGDTNGVGDLFVHDLANHVTSRVSVHTNGTQGNQISYDARISADGNYVTFDSDASNLVDNDTNGFRDVFVHDRQKRTTTRLSPSAGGEKGGVSEANRISADGRFVTFRSEAANLVVGDENKHADIFVAAVP